MGDFLGAGDTIHGEKIAFWFGKVNVAPEGVRSVARLGLNGEAIVVKPLKRAHPPIVGKGYPRLRCQSAHGEADAVRCSDQKVQHGSHRAYEGTLRGEAWCKIVVPW